jgi:hypothetical protein
MEQQEHEVQYIQNDSGAHPHYPILNTDFLRMSSRPERETSRLVPRISTPSRLRNSYTCNFRENHIKPDRIIRIILEERTRHILNIKSDY